MFKPFMTKKITRASLDELAETMPVLSEEIQRGYIGGWGNGSSSNPFTMEQFESMIAGGTWMGGFVDTPWGLSNMLGGVTVTGSMSGSSGSMGGGSGFMTNWNNHSTQIAFANDLAGLFTNFGNLPGWANIPSWGVAGINAYNDFLLIQQGSLTGIAMTDAIMNVISVAGKPGAAVSFFYNAAKWGASGIMHIEQELRGELDRLINRHFGLGW